MELEQAKKVAEEFVRAIGRTTICERIEIAGSIRREKPDPGDIEILAIPVLTPPRPQFGEKRAFKTLLDRALWNMELERVIEPVKAGEKFKQFWLLKNGGLHVIKLDLFLVTPPAQWGVLDVIRTGPDTFSKWMVTPRSKGGALPDGYYVKWGAVWAGYEPDEIPDLECRQDMPEEMDFLKFCGLGWTEPRDREARWTSAAQRGDGDGVRVQAED